MTGNPFRGGGTTDPGDQLYFDGKAIGGGGGQLHPDDAAKVVIYDPATGQTNGPGAAFVKAVNAAVEVRLKQVVEMTIKAVTQATNEHLEKRLGPLRAEVRAAIHQSTAQFLGETRTDDDPPKTMAELNRMAERHKADMAQFRSTRGRNDE